MRAAGTLQPKLFARPAGRRCVRAVPQKPHFSQMERHDGIAVRGDHVRPGIDVRVVYAADVIGRFDQGECRPLGLAERRSDALQLTARTTIQQDCAIQWSLTSFRPGSWLTVRYLLCFMTKMLFGRRTWTPTLGLSTSCVTATFPAMLTS